MRPPHLSSLGVTTCLAVAAASPCSGGPGHDQTCRKTKVAVLGAGAAGVAAARSLHDASISDFVIVETNDHIGGRVAHVDFGTKPDGSPYTVELGANWIQGLQLPGGPTNPIWTLVQKHGVANIESNYTTLLTYDETGFNDYTAKIDVYEKAMDAVTKYAGVSIMDNLQDVSMRAALSLAGWKPGKDMQAQALDWWFWDTEAVTRPELSSMKFGIAGSNATSHIYGSQNNMCIDDRGFNTYLIDEVNDFLGDDDDRLLLNASVTNITYSDDSVTVTLADGSCIEAEHAIVTFSVGVLQSDKVHFEPALPQWKQEAIESFTMGTYTKLFMQFNETFWDPNGEFLLYADPHERGYFPSFQSLSTKGYFPDSNIIFATVIQDQSHKVEKQTDNETKAQLMAVLRNMFPDKDVPEPIDFFYPRWNQEEWAMGSYSNWPVGVSLERHQNLRANAGRVWFAGEATSAEFFGFMHGAWFEGEEVGMRVASMLGGQSKPVGVYSNTTVSGPMVRYEALKGTTTWDEYNESNGWIVSTFQEYGEQE